MLERKKLEARKLVQFCKIFLSKASGHGMPVIGVVPETSETHPVAYANKLLGRRKTGRGGGCAQ